MYFQTHIKIEFFLIVILFWPVGGPRPIRASPYVLLALSGLNSKAQARKKIGPFGLVHFDISNNIMHKLIILS
jgi:hypothetical protein